ncbi:MAG: methyltransferase domain-containing protein [Verrucomicrobiota bacterium]
MINPKFPRLNLGCGYCSHPEFVNADFTSTEKGVHAMDLRKPLPFPDHSFDLVYHCHVLEHFTLEKGESLLGECYRVLKTNGILRVVVPDLAQWAHAYLESLQNARNGDSTAKACHRWLIIELIDQMVRTQTGGIFVDYMRSAPPDVLQFIENRVGPLKEFSPDLAPPSAPTVKTKICSVLRQIRRPQILLDTIKAYWFPETYKAEQFLRFRAQGENHLWMYDEINLKHVLESTGFTSTSIQTAEQSLYPNWNTYQLDIFPDSSIRRPNSLYMEARK